LGLPEHPFDRGDEHIDERLDPVGHFDPDVLATFREYHGEMAAIWGRST